ncbi:GABA permease [compost metagenome]
MRRMMLRLNVELTFRMWLFPWLTYLVIAFICAALAVMLVTPEHRAEVTSTIGLALVISFIGIVLTRQHQQPEKVASIG